MFMFSFSVLKEMLYLNLSLFSWSWSVLQNIPFSKHKLSWNISILIKLFGSDEKGM